MSIQAHTLSVNTMDPDAIVTAVCARVRVVIRVVPPNDPSSATRPTRAHDCNLDAMAGFAAAPG